jgi:hypothetical protein
MQEGWAALHDANAAFVIDCEVQLVEANKLENSGQKIHSLSTTLA